MTHDLPISMAPIATKSGALMSVSSAAVSYMNQNVGFFSSLAFLAGIVIGLLGLLFQARSVRNARLMAEAEDKRNQELHELRMIALKKQVEDDA